VSLKWFFSLRFQHWNPVYVFPLPHTRYLSRLSHFSRFDHPSNIGCGVEVIKLIMM
jgi:hypothetical protein